MRGVEELKGYDSRAQGNVLMKKSQVSAWFQVVEAFQRPVTSESLGFSSRYPEMAIFSLN